MDIVRYAAGIARRLVPTAVVVLTATVLTCILLLPVTRWDRTLKEAMATSLFGENLALIHYATDYLARDDATTPFRSGWAISTQVQAYVMIAVVMGVVTMVRIDQARRRTIVLSFLGVVGLASFAWAIRSVSVDQAAAYFDSLARMWEFCAGGAVAVILAIGAPSWRIRAAVGWLGLAMLLSTAWVFGLTRQFPGWASLWPVAGGLLMLAAGSRPDPVGGLGVGRLLAARPLTWLGDISYGIYLWHGPVVVFALLWSDRVHLGPGGGLLVLLASIGLAASSKALIERPLTRWMEAGGTHTGVLAKGAALILVGIVAVGGWWAISVRREASEMKLQSGISNPGGAMAPSTIMPADTMIVPRPMVARHDLSDVYSGGCHVDDGDATPAVCRFGPPDAAVHIAVAGSSHSAHWLPAVQKIAERHGWRISAWTKSSCQLGGGDFDSFGLSAPDCGLWNRRVQQKLEAERPDVVLTLAAFSGVVPDHLSPGAGEVWLRLGQNGVRVVAMRDTPWSPIDVPDCVQVHGPQSEACVMARPETRLLPPPGGWPDNVTVVNTLDWVCGPRLCPPVIGGVLVYRDRDHLTATFAASLDRWLEPVLEAVVAQGRPTR